LKTHNRPVADLHCDLLCYLEGSPVRKPTDRAVRCSLPQLMEGNVKWQTCAIFTETGPSSVAKGHSQLENLLKLSSKELTFYPAFENASSFCSEEEPFEKGVARLESWMQKGGRPLYISLTWNGENRFGGGAHTRIGLKEDGKRLLENLHGKNIAVDFSHASDHLAYDLIETIDRLNLEIRLIASHSNAREVSPVPRNLPTAIAKEIFKRNGLIGLNLYAPFLGNDPEAILRHLDFWLSLGGEKGICFGADFFYEGDFRSRDASLPYFKGFENASCYPSLLEFAAAGLQLKEPLLEQLAYKNFLDFYQLTL